MRAQGITTVQGIGLDPSLKKRLKFLPPLLLRMKKEKLPLAMWDSAPRKNGSTSTSTIERPAPPNREKARREEPRCASSSVSCWKQLEKR